MGKKYLKRLDVTVEQPAIDQVRGYWVKLIEEENITLLNIAINAYLLALPNLVETDVHLVGNEVRTYDGMGNIKIHSATLTFYYVGASVIAP